ncbi:MAG: hypothetical protein Tsb009_28200 [Planctomycetaceae bacterium]
MAIMRIGLGCILLYDALSHWPYVVELYSRDGMPMPLAPGTFLEPTALGANASVLLYGVMLFSLLAVILGWQTRISLVVVFILTAYFGLLDTAGTFKKYSVISLHWLMLLAFSESAAVLSVDACFNPARTRYVRLTPAWPRRLMQFLIASVYLGAVITKIRMPDFGTGDLLMFSLLDDRWGGNRFGMWLSTKPRLIMLASYGTVLLELSGALLLWIRRTRLPVLILLMLFHATIGLTMHVGIFSPVMLVALIAFVEREDLAILRRFSVKATVKKPCIVPQAKPSGKWISLGVFLLCGGVFAGANFGLFWMLIEQNDLTGRISNRFEELSNKEIEEIQTQNIPAAADYFHRIEIGSRRGFRHTFGNRKKFQRGMTVHVVARLQQNHPPLEIEWILKAPDGEEPFRRFQPIASAVTYVYTGFRMDSPEHQLGTYVLLLEVDGETVARKSFELVE